jgi:hypothetical protein
MKVKIHKILAVIALVLVLSSCVPYYYVPSNLNIPLPEKKGDFKGEVNFLNYSVGIQSSYALTDKLVILGDISTIESEFPQRISIFQPQCTHNIFADVGCGYYSKIPGKWRYEILGGLGFGSSSGIEQQDFRWMDGGPGDGFKLEGITPGIFFQGDIGRIGKKAEIDFGIRCRGIRTTGSYSIGWIDDTRYGPIDNSYFRATQDEKGLNGVAILAEPCIKIILGSHICRWNISIGYSAKLTGPDVDLWAHNYGLPNIYEKAFFNTGLTIFLRAKE